MDKVWLPIFYIGQLKDIDGILSEILFLLKLYL